MASRVSKPNTGLHDGLNGTAASKALSITTQAVGPDAATGLAGRKALSAASLALSRRRSIAPSLAAGSLAVSALLASRCRPILGAKGKANRRRGRGGRTAEAVATAAIQPRPVLGGPNRDKATGMTVGLIERLCYFERVGPGVERKAAKNYREKVSGPEAIFLRAVASSGTKGEEGVGKGHKNFSVLGAASRDAYTPSYL